MGKKLDLNYALLNNSIKHIESEIHILEYGNVEFILSIKDNYGIEKNVSLNFDVEFSGSLDDVDNDGILDASDFIIGDEKDVLTNSKNLKINITNYSNDPNLDKIKILTFYDGNKTFLRKRYNFSSKKLHIQDVIYLRYKINKPNTFILGGLKKENNVLEKTFFFDASNSENFTGICIVDKDILSISEINSDCSKQGEILLPNRRI